MSSNVRILGVFLVVSYLAKVVLVPLFLALFLAMLLEPIVRILSPRLSRTGASTLVVIFAAAGATLVGYLLYTASLELAGALPEYSAKLNSLLAALNRASGLPDFRGLNPDLDWRRLVYSGLGTMYEVLSILIFVPLLMFYFMVDKENMVESFNVVNGRYFNLPKLNMELPRMLRVFFAANLMALIFLVLVHGVLAIAAGFENWVSLAMLTGFLNLLPVVGAPLAAVAYLVLGIGVTVNLPLAIAIFVAVSMIHFIANNVIIPILVGQRLNMNPVALLLGLLFWSWIWGVAGFFLAVPMTALIKILLECNPETYAFANIMAAKPKRVLGGRSPLLAPERI